MMHKKAIVFPGQGVQYAGMGEDIYRAYPEVHKIYEEASDTLGYDMANLCFEGPDDKLKLTENTQPAILTTCIATYTVLKNRGITADYFAGLSLGEYTALIASGVLSFKDAVTAVKLRGKYMQEEVPVGQGAMAAIIGLKDDVVIDICAKASELGIVTPANFNCPKQIAIAGEKHAVNKAINLANDAGALKAVMLDVSAPFHTSILIGAGEKLKLELDKINFNTLDIPVISNVTAKPYNENIIDLLIKQVSSPVKWTQSVEYMIAQGVDTFIEVGPGKTLSGFIRKIDKKTKRLNISNLEGLSSLESLES